MTNSSKLTLPSLFNESVKKYANEKSLVFVGEDNYTYQQLGNDVELVATLLSNLGVTKGDKVAILSTNMPNWGVAFFAITVIGAIAVPILPDFHENEIKTIIEHSEAKVMFVSAGLFGNLSDESKQLITSLILVENFALVPNSATTEQLSGLQSSLPTVVNKSVQARELC